MNMAVLTWPNVVFCSRSTILSPVIVRTVLAIAVFLAILVHFGQGLPAATSAQDEVRRQRCAHIFGETVSRRAIRPR